MVGVDKASDDPVESALTLFTPLVGQLSFGSMVGYTSGYALKKIGKMAAFAIGAGFIFLQSMAAAGYIEVDWMKIKDTTVAKLDTVSLIIYAYFFGEVAYNDCHSRNFPGW
jgi:uncharacterized membrane protein (Fun14 family)